MKWGGRMSDHFYEHYNDSEILKKVASLNKRQTKKFDEAMIKTDNDIRHSLFIASSYPIEEDYE
jgi:hypothetical protein